MTGEKDPLTPTDLVSQPLRAVEREIDCEYLKNSLLGRPFAEAAWYFLAGCEDVMVGGIVRAGVSRSEPVLQSFMAMADNLIVHTKWPLKWLTDGCARGGAIPRKYDAAMYAAADALSKLSLKYISFEAAFTFATLGLTTLRVDGQRISSDSIKADTCFDAYDRLTEPSPVDLAASEADPGRSEFLERVAASVRVEGEWFSYDLNPRLVQVGFEAMRSSLDRHFVLPKEWQFPRFSLDDFARVAGVLSVLATIHFHARLVAAQRGCEGFGYARALIIMERDELLRRLRRYSGVPEAAIEAIVDALTYGGREVRSPDPALQPLIRLQPSTYAIAPSIILNSSLERNLSVLLNRLPAEKSVYARLSNQREARSRDEIINALRAFGLRFWYGNVPGWGEADEVDLAIVSDDEKRCLILELKSFITPSDPREVRDRSEDVRTGIVQVQERKAMAIRHPGSLRQVLEIDDRYRLHWAVASETSIGARYVQAQDVPVIRTSHLLSKLSRERSVAACCDWLESRGYLPVEGQHYKTIEIEATIGSWTLEWYGIDGLVDDYMALT